MNRNSTLTIAQFEFIENIRSRWLVVYGFVFFVFSNLIVYFSGTNPMQVNSSLLSLVLIITPIFSLIFGCVSFSESIPFLELLIAQPISRRDMYIGKWLGLSSGLGLSYMLGLSAGVLFRVTMGAEGIKAFTLLLLLGTFLTFVFIAVAFLVTNLSTRKEIIYGLVLAFWFYFFILYDLLIFGIVISFGDYQLEWPLIIMSLLNPIDLVRIIMTLNMDLSALMGYTGALFEHFFGGLQGISVSLFCLVIWIVAPLYIGLRLFCQRNL